MKKGFAPIFIVLIVLIVSGAGLATVALLRNKPETDQVSTATTDIFEDQTDLCTVLSKDTVASFLGKDIVKTQSITSGTLQSCQYYLDGTHALVLNHDLTSVADKLKGHEILDRSVVTNSEIPMEHAVIMQENGLINEIYLILRSEEFISINRPNGTLISEEGIVDFAAKLAGFLKIGSPDTSQKTDTEKTVPLPQEEDVVRNFFSLINERKIPEALSMMSTPMVGDESTKQAWGVQFNDIKSIAVQKIEPSIPDSWSDDKHVYKVTLEAYVSSDASDAPIPYHGWEDNPNYRWVEIVKEGNLWKINSIATGP